MKTWHGILIVAIIHTIVLVGMVVTRNAPYANGVEVILRTEPVDPRDLMRGYYVRLGYEISRVEIPQSESTALAYGSRVYVALVEGDDGYWNAATVYTDRDAIPDGTLYIEGYATSIERPITEAVDETTTLSVLYGIERYYASQALARELDTMSRDQRISVAVRVAPNGQAGISALLIDGERAYEEGLF